jgi:hypothetical protein
VFGQLAAMLDSPGAVAYGTCVSGTGADGRGCRTGSSTVPQDSLMHTKASIDIDACAS